MEDLAATSVKIASSAETSRVTVQNRPPEEQEKKQPEAQPSQKVDLDAAVEQMQDFAIKNGINLNFSVHKATGRTVIQVIDADSHKVVREIPPEEVLNLAVSFEKMAGHLLSAKA